MMHATHFLLTSALAASVSAWNTIVLPPCVDEFKPFVSSGCYQDKGHTTLTFNPRLPREDMTVAKCIASCKGNGFRYAGLEYYGECYCGSSVNGPQIGDENCSYACNGDKNDKCGGSDAISVWQDPTFTKGPDDVSVESYKSLGCYSDDLKQGRALSQQLNVKDVTAAKCINACRANGFPFAGTQYGSECWCGAVLANGTAPVDNAQCNINCAGDATAKCGGSKRLDLFVAEELESLEPCGKQTNPATSSIPKSTASPTSSNTSVLPPSTETSVPPPPHTTPTTTHYTSVNPPPETTSSEVPPPPPPPPQTESKTKTSTQVAIVEPPPSTSINPSPETTVKHSTQNTMNSVTQTTVQPSTETTVKPPPPPPPPSQTKTTTLSPSPPETKTSTNLPPLTGSTTKPPPPPVTTTTVPPPPGTTSTQSPPPDTTSTEIPPPGSTSTQSPPPPGTTSTVIPPPDTTSTKVPPTTRTTTTTPRTTTTSKPPPRTTSTKTLPPPTTTKTWQTKTKTTTLPPPTNTCPPEPICKQVGKPVNGIELPFINCIKWNKIEKFACLAACKIQFAKCLTGGHGLGKDANGRIGSQVGENIDLNDIDLSQFGMSENDNAVQARTFGPILNAIKCKWQLIECLKVNAFDFSKHCKDCKKPGHGY